MIYVSSFYLARTEAQFNLKVLFESPTADVACKSKLLHFLE